ncbi:MAG TPA: hypothetical protein VMZ11_08185 [Mycobacteriales bacterium]|nr:hypothetical protein [Mycobacteriales bacterium]
MTEPVGSAAEEAARLFAAAQEWARARFDHEHLATGSAECQVCPVCQGIAALRQVRPETVEHLLDAAAAFAAALKSAFPQPDPQGPGNARTPVQHIDVRKG